MKRALAILTVASLGLFSCQSTPQPDPSCTDPALVTSVELADFEFDPACIGATSGDTIALENTGEAPHTFTVEGTDVDVNLAVGATGQADLSSVTPGAYAITCTYHPQMTGTLVVG